MFENKFAYLIKETKEISDIFCKAGFTLYLVGGLVRDVILGRALLDVNETSDLAADLSVDLDFTTDAKPDDVERLCSNWADAIWTQGKKFGTIAMKKNGKTLEITTHRGEMYRTDSRKPDVVFSSDIEEDLSRRDFTINAIALNLYTGKLLDPFNGIDDIKNLRLRTPMDPIISFSDDPLRMLRAARFIAGLNLEPDKVLIEALVQTKDRISIVSAERIRDELDKLLLVEKPSNGLWLLVKTGIMNEFLPEIPALALEQDPINRHKDVLAHTIAVVENASQDRILRLACLFHDIGKPRTRAYGENGITFHHHDVVGARMTRSRMRALKYPNEDIQDVSQLVCMHLRFHTFRMGWTDSAVRRYVTDAGHLVDKLNELTRCDCTTRNQKKALEISRRIDTLEQRIKQLKEKEQLDSIKPDLDGDEIMKYLQISPSKVVGEALSFLLDIRMEEGSVGKEEAYRRLDNWWQNKNSPENHNVT